MKLVIRHVVSGARHFVDFETENGVVIGSSVTHDRTLSQFLAFTEAMLRDDVREAMMEGTLEFEKAKTVRH